MTATATRRRYAVGSTLSAALLIGASVLVPSTSASAATVSFTATGAAETWVVPAGVCEVDWAVIGGTGGGFPTSGDNSGSTVVGGRGGFVTAYITVAAGDTFTIQVGSAGGDATGANGNGLGGVSGGSASGGNSAGSYSGGGGGGASIVRAGGPSAAPVIVAGGGGGRGSVSGGSAAGEAGLTGGNGQNVTGATGGGGATASAGGAAGTASGLAGPESGSAGAQYVGGNAATGAGGGGGGYFGGGGGGSNKVVSFFDSDGAGGGGGSNFVGSTANMVVNGTATTLGGGQVIVTTTACPVPTPTLTSASWNSADQLALAFTFGADDSAVDGAEYSIDGGATWLPMTATRIAAGSWTGVITGLQPTSQYSVVVRATSAAGASSITSNAVTVAAEVAVVTPAATSDGSALAATGFDQGWIGGLGGLLLALGAAVFAFSRLRRGAPNTI